MLRVVRADTGTALADALAGTLAIPAADPLATEEVVVHSRGMERWLSQHLSRRLGAGDAGDGVCANVVFPFPVQVVRRAVRAVGGPDPQASAWDPDRLVWPLVGLVEAGLGPWAAPLVDRLADDPTDRFEVLRGVAGLFDSYAIHRPDLVRRWLAGQDVAADGSRLERADLWQPQLLRELRQVLDQPTLAESVVQACADLVAGRGPVPGLPARLGLFGFTALPATHLAVLVALAQRIAVTLYLLHPSPGLWAAREGVAGGHDADRLPLLPARAALAVPPPRNRLLRSWGRDAAEVQLVVATIAPDAAVEVLDAPAAAAPRTLLGRLQAGVREDRPPVAEGSGTRADGSVQVHACHGRTRQVQVLRDEILRLMAADPTLQPRDIVVMCPEVEAFAPLVTAHLAVPPDDPEGRPDLRVRLADRALRQLNPMLRVTDDVLALAGQRLTSSRLLDLAGTDPVRRRFAFTDDDLQQLQRWAEHSGMRWGLDAAERTAADVPVPDGTVDAGLARLLLGIAVADEDDRTVGGVTPLDDVEGSGVGLAGRLAELADRLGHVLSRLRIAQPIRDWVAALTEAADLLLREHAAEPWQRTELAALLDEIAVQADGSPVLLALPEVRALLADRLRGRPSWANHRTGDLTVCTLVPMRSVPHRVVCLVGMDDETFPRRRHPRGDDLIARHPRVGDRDVRTEDRQLLLDAVMSAAEAVVITYAGIDERTGQPQPPCVPVAELLRALDGMAPGTAAAVTTTHPLHPHDPRAFTEGRPGFDRQAHAAAVVRSRPPAPAVPVGPLPQVDIPTAVDVERLVDFTRDPVRHFYRHTIGAWIPEDPERADAQVPLDVDPLVQWQIAEDLLRGDVLDDPDRVDAVVAAHRGRGVLPPQPLDASGVDKACDGARSVAGFRARLDLPTGVGDRHALHARLGDRSITGTVGGVHGDRLVHCTYSRLVAKQIIPVWVRLLALTVDQPDTPWQAWLVGRHETKRAGRGRAPHGVHFPPLGATAQQRATTAGVLLGDVLALHDDGLREPLVVPPLTAAAYAIERLLRHNHSAVADDRAAVRWDPQDRGFDNEALLPSHMLRFGDVVPYRALRDQPARPDDARLGHDPEPHRLGGLAVRLWGPLLTRCQAATP